MVAFKKKVAHLIDVEPDSINDIHASASHAAVAEAGADRKTIYGDSRNETINGTNGFDKLNGKGGNDKINGKDGIDFLIGDTGNDKLNGGAGNDWLRGGTGHDTLSGGGGRDQLIGGTGKNAISGGGGIDTAVLKGSIADYEVDYEGDKMIVFKAGTRDTLDHTVEKIKFGDTTINRQLIHDAVITGIETAHGMVGDGDSTIDTTVVIRGTADVFTRIRVMLDGIEVGQTVTGSDGTWSFDHSGTRLADGSHVFSAVSDWGGTKSVSSPTVTMTVGHVVDLTTLGAGQGFVIQGDASYDRAGYSVSSAGDINGDGFDDLIIGAVTGDDGGDIAGEAYVIFGKASGFGEDVTIGGVTRKVIDLTTLNAADGFIIQGDAVGDLAGQSVSSAGDVNGDGFDDLIVGAPAGTEGSIGAGEAYIVFGTATGFGEDVIIGGVTRRVLDLTTLNANQGFIIQGDAAGDSAGAFVSSVGDINGDGFDDLSVGAIAGDDGGSTAGEAYVVFGTATGFGEDVTTGGVVRRIIDLTNLNAADGFIIQGDAGADLAGFSVSFAGDVNGDGFDDLVVGAPLGDDGGDRAGEAYVVFGKASGFGEDVIIGGATRKVIDLTTLSAADGFVIQGDTTGDKAGQSVSYVGDVNGDGFDDLIVGAPYGDDGEANAGEAYVLFGRTTGFGEDVTIGGVTRKVIDLTTLSAVDGFVIQGAAAGDRAGFSVSSAGDVNGDGFDDLVVGAAFGDDGGTDAGKAYVVFGKTTGIGEDVTIGGVTRKVIDLTTLSAADGFIIRGDGAYDQAGWSVSSAGDVNGDGFDDLIVGAAFSDDGGIDAGEAYVFFGGNFGSTTSTINLGGSAAAEILMGNAGDDRLSGNGGADIYRSGAGNDRITIVDAGFRLIDAGGGDQDVVVLSGSGFTFDARNFSNSQLTGIEGFDLSTGNNTLILAASDVFHFSNTGNGLFTGSGNHNNLVIEGDGNDTLQLFDAGAANAAWALSMVNRQLDGSAAGDYNLVNLIETGSGRVLASLAVDQDVTLFL